jgi:hypothetical protein
MPNRYLSRQISERAYTKHSFRFMVHCGTTDVERHSERKLLALRKPRPDNSVLGSTARLVAFYFYGVTKVAMLFNDRGYTSTCSHNDSDCSDMAAGFCYSACGSENIIQEPILAMCGMRRAGGWRVYG